MALGALASLMTVGYALTALPPAVSSPDESGVRPLRVSQVTQACDRQPVYRAGCSAAACHGAPATRALSDEPGALAWTTAATQWHARDPHVGATEVLAGPLAEQMMNRLRADQPERWAAEALDEVRCLACHTNPALAVRTNPSERTRLRSEGVSCEACHGNASGWLLEHTAWSAADRPGRYETLGMAPLYDIGERAFACVGCHVGAPADPARGYPRRDMNHDMIAAGHPRLNFEFADYQRRLPPHWFERDRTREPGVPRAHEFEAKAWLVGRVASAEAACRLLADRAGRAASDDGADWPELSETKCFACHRELLPSTWRATRGQRRHITWQTIWPLTRSESRAAFAAALPGKMNEVVVELTALEKVLAHREPRPSDTAQSAARAATVLRAVRSEVTAISDRSAAQAVLALYSHVNADALDWDESCQVTQGLVSLEWMRLRRVVPGQRVENPLFTKIYPRLALPRPDGKDHFDSPRRLETNGTNENLNRLLASVRAECAATFK